MKDVKHNSSICLKAMVRGGNITEITYTYG